MKKSTKEATKRLTPTPDVLRELYLLSGNNCAMPDCDHVILDRKGVVVGHICHIEAAMPDGPRFNPNQTNEDRRALSNLVLMCAGHHIQIDSKKYEAQWPVAAVRKLKDDHESKFKGIDGSLKQAFRSTFVDSTASLVPSEPGNFEELERLVPNCEVHEEQAKKRASQIKRFVSRAAKAPETERDFMLSVIKRAITLGSRENVVSVHVDDIRNAFKISANKVKTLGDGLRRYRLGDVDLVGTNDGDEYHVQIYDPSDYVNWFDIDAFCRASGHELQEFVMHLKFGLLDKP